VTEPAHPHPPRHVPSAGDLRATFDAADPFTVGLEEEVFVCSTDGSYVEDADAVLTRLADDPRYKPELPAGQLELLTEPHETVDAALDALRGARRDLLATGGSFLASGLHPTAPPLGRLRSGPRYERLARDYRDVARRQLVASLQVHVAVPGAERALATHNALRAHLPELAALAGNSPFHAGRDTGLASARPPVNVQLPRQGLPPHLDSWEELAGAYTLLGDTAPWWWELRPHPRFGTLEVRVCDSQPAFMDVERVARAVVAVVRRVAEAGGQAPVAAWRIAENRWSATRDGLEGQMADPRTGRVRSTRAALEELGVEAPARDGASRLREVGVERAAAWLCERFATGL
jgi:glutamate---cysteine ligase / carboxylate-amine ligase